MLKESLMVPHERDPENGLVEETPESTRPPWILRTLMQLCSYCLMITLALWLINILFEGLPKCQTRQFYVGIIEVNAIATDEDVMAELQDRLTKYRLSPACTPSYMATGTMAHICFCLLIVGAVDAARFYLAKLDYEWNEKYPKRDG